MRGQRRLRAHHAAAAFEAFEQRRFLTAHAGAGAHAGVEVDRASRTGDVRAEQFRLLRDGDRPAHRGDCVRILGADEHVSGGRGMDASASIHRPGRLTDWSRR
jgi:hypothetical protein